MEHLKKPEIIVIAASGTMVQYFNKELNQYVPTDLKEQVQSIGQELNVNVETIELSVSQYSPNLDLDFLNTLATLIQRIVMDELVNGVVVIHGTDTMEITAYFLHRSVESYGKPIVLTGAMRVVTNSDYDGRVNITNSIKQASNSESLEYGFGVTVNFAGKIHSPLYVTKEHSFAIDTFSSGNNGFVGTMHKNRINWKNKSNRPNLIPLPVNLESVPIVHAFPGVTEDYLDGFIDKYKGVVIVGYGNGNVSMKMYQAIKKVVENGLKVILVTNCKYGGVYLEFEHIGGSQSLKDLGVIFGSDLNPYQAMVVASLVLNNHKISPDANLQSYFELN